MPNNQLKDTFQFPFKKRILTRRSTWTLIRRYRARPQPIATVRNNTHDHCPQESSTRFHPRPEISRPQKTLDRRACTNCRSSLSLSLSSIRQLRFPRGGAGVWTARIPRESGHVARRLRDGNRVSIIRVFDRGRRYPPSPFFRRVTFQPYSTQCRFNILWGARRDTDASRLEEDEGGWKWNLKAGGGASRRISWLADWRAI